MPITFLEIWNNVVSNLADVNDDVIELAGLSLLSSVCNRNVSVAHSTWIYYPNIWVMLVGPTGCGKSTVINAVRHFLTMYDGQPPLPEDCNPEGLIAELDERGRAHSGSHGFFINDEFGEFLLKGQKIKYMTGIEGTLSKLYDSPKLYERRLVKRKYRLKNTYVSVLTASQPERLEDCGPSIITSGLLPRFITKNMPAKPFGRVGNIMDYEKAFKLLVLQLQFLEELLNTKSVRVKITPDIMDYVMKWQNGISTKFGTDPISRAIVSRLAEKAIKLSILYRLNKLTSVPLVLDNNSTDKDGGTGGGDNSTNSTNSTIQQGVSKLPSQFTNTTHNTTYNNNINNIYNIYSNIRDSTTKFNNSTISTYIPYLDDFDKNKLLKCMLLQCSVELVENVVFIPTGMVRHAMLNFAEGVESEKLQLYNTIMGTDYNKVQSKIFEVVEGGKWKMKSEILYPLWRYRTKTVTEVLDGLVLSGMLERKVGIMGDKTKEATWYRRRALLTPQLPPTGDNELVGTGDKQ